MNLLSIDTSTRKLSLAVSKDEKVVKYRNVLLKRPLSSSIMPSIRKLLKDTGVPLKKIDGFAVGLGPGSFTSLRVGLSTVKGLAFATRKPVVGIPSLDVLALNVKENNVQVCTLCDARRNMVYACLYDKNGEALKNKSEYMLAGIHEVLKGMSGEIYFIGDGVELYKRDIQKAKKIRAQFVDQDQVFPQARFLARLAFEQFEMGQQGNIDRMIPLYLYPDHCQIKNKGSKQ